MNRCTALPLSRHTRNPIPPADVARAAIAPHRLARATLYQRLLYAFGLMLLIFATATAAMAGGRTHTGSTVFLDAGTRQLTVTKHKSLVLEIERPYSQALVADDQIADLVPLTDQLLSVVGKKVGSTNLALLDLDKNIIANVEVNVTLDLREVRAKLKENLPGEGIRVTEANGRLLLTGDVRNSRAALKAVTIAEQYAPKAVTNMLEVRDKQQVMLEVRFVEASRRASKELGIGTRVRSNRYNEDTGGQALLTGPLISSAALASGAQPFGTMISQLIKGGTNVDLIIRALEERNLARRLAEPNLVTLSGQSANFLAGGEFPFPVDAGNDRVTISFKTFGVALKFTPTVLSDGLINLDIEPEVSELDETAGVSLSNVRIPGLIVRRAKTSVEVGDGQSFAIAGLLQHSNTRLTEQVPWLGRVPVLGALFRSAAYRKQETDLVIIITPRLVRPARPGEHLATPLTTSRATDERGYFLRDKQISPPRSVAQQMQRGRLTPVHSGHIIRLTRFGDDP